MQSLTDAPRSTLTEDQVRHLLAGAPGVTYDRGCDVLDSNLAVVEDISGDFLSGTVTRTMAASIHGTCSLVLARDVDYSGTTFLRPWMTISDGDLSARFNAGVFVPRKPDTAYGASLLSNAVSGSDRLLQLARPIPDAYVTTEPLVLNAVLEAFAAAGIPSSQVLLDGTAAAELVPNGSRTWPLLGGATSSQPADAPSDDVSSSSTTWLRIINDLLGSVNYRGVWADQDGRFRGQPYVSAAGRGAEFGFSFDDLLSSIVGRERTRTLDVSQVPNLWIFQRNNLTDGSGSPVEPTEGAGQYTVRNDDDGDTSIDARGGDPLGVFATVIQLDAASQAALVAAGDLRAAADRRVAATLAVRTAPFPLAGHADVYTYNDVEAVGGQVKVISTGWTLDFGSSATTPADMNHSWAVVA